MTALEYYRKKPYVIDALLAALPDLRKSFEKAEESPEKTHRFLQESEFLQRLDEHLSAFNVFSAINVSGAEVRHSNFLAWLLAPDGSHGFGDRFLRAFLRVASTEAGEANHSARKFGRMDAWKLDEAIIKPEFSHGSRLNRIDLVITLPKERALIVIENKLHSGQRKGQLAEYRDLIEGEGLFRGFKKLYVFLTLKGEPPEIPDFLSLTYRALVTGFTQDAGTRPRYEKEDAQAMVIQHYLAVIRGNEDSRFNLFRALKADQKELRHSDMIAWLLNPSESHGLGNSFLDGLLKLVMGKSKQTSLVSSAPSKTEISVHREFQDIDILVICEAKKWLVAIENKWGSKESKGQLSTYQAFLAAQFPDFKRCHVFLTHDGSRPFDSDSPYVPISYADLVPLLQAAQKKIGGRTGSLADQITLFADQYFRLVTLQLKSVNKAKVQLPDELASICQALHQQNPQEISGLIGSVLRWQRDVVRHNENLLYRLADQAFGKKTFKSTYEVWQRFVPPDFDDIRSLRNSSADDMLQNKLIQYTFHNIPFGHADVPYGSNAAVEKKGIFLTLGMAKARTGFEPLRQMIYAGARQQPEVFNAATSENLRGSRFSTLLKFKLASVEDFLRHDLRELEPVLAARFGRFVRYQHCQVIKMLSRPEIADFERD